MSHHRLSWQVFSSVSAEYLQELSGSLRIPHGDRDETIVEVWEALFPTDKLEPAEFFRDLSTPLVGSQMVLIPASFPSIWTSYGVGKG